MTFSNYLCKGSQLYFRIVAVVILSLVASGSTKTGPTHNKVVVCYFYIDALKQPDGSYSLEKFNPDLCTHIIYTFTLSSLGTFKKEDKYALLTGLKQKYPHIKVSLAGGSAESSESFSIAIADNLQRDEFVKGIGRFIKFELEFDGLDLFWEYPTQRGGMVKDRENFVLLTKELREEFDKYNLLLTSTISGKKNIIDEAYDVPEISRYLDFLHIQSYDYHSSEDKKVGFNAPLTSTSDDVLSVQYTIDYLIKLGAPPSKLVLGLPFYGRSFNTTLEGKIGDVSDDTGFQGPFALKDGFLGYNEICLMLSKTNSGWTSSWDAKASEVIAHSQRDEFNGVTRVVTFDSTRSIANKVMFAIRKSLAGVAVKSVETDDFRGECEPANDTFIDFKRLDFPKRLNRTNPLLNTINEAIIYALEEIETEQQAEQQKELQVVRETEEQSKPQRKKPEKNEMNNLICYLSIPKRCFPNI